MTVRPAGVATRSAGATTPSELTADVLVIGGGPAGAWAAWSVASHGADVVLAEKGYLGTSGATAPGGANLLYVPPDEELRASVVADRMSGGGYLSEPRWIHRVLDGVYESLALVEEWGYPFVRDADGTPMRNHLQGPEYMRLMRRKVHRAGVRILDQAPALELLADADGIAGARGLFRRSGAGWRVRASAVVIATGGCAFLSNGLGCNVLTGEGLLMAAESGAALSGMEFSRAYAPSAQFGSVTRGRMLGWATLSDSRGRPLGRGGARRPDLLATALRDGPVFAILDKADTPAKRQMLRRSHAIFFLPYDRAGIDPFTQRFPLTLRFEGTVRGTGGIQIAGEDCSATVPGLFAAGDAASRERVHGGKSGGGAFNAAWAICSGRWAGAGAARHAREAGPAATRRPVPAGVSGLGRHPAVTQTIDNTALVQAIQAETLPLDISYFRSEPVLRSSLARLDNLVPAVRGRPGSSARERLRAREAAGMLATARWMHTAALHRTETRAMHTLAEYPTTDPGQRHRLVLSGTDDITVGREPVPADPAG